MPTFTPLHRDLTFLSPLSEARVARIVTFLNEFESGLAGYRGILGLACLHLVAV
jgi:hypothetical protein